jgi:hypothetical protein
MMRKSVVLLALLPFLFLACTHIGKKPVSISWPQEFDYIEALCEIDVMLKARQYTGDMSLRAVYPDRLFLEVYGPFGNTVLSVDRSRDHFVMKTDDEELTDENDFYRLFRVRIADIIEDLTLKGTLGNEGDHLVRERPEYTVSYYLNDRDSRICWKVPEGDLCMKFLEVSFSRERSLGKSGSGNE